MKFAWSNHRPAVEADQFDEYGDAGQLASEIIRQIARGADGEEIINKQDALAGESGISVYLKNVHTVQ